MSCTVFQNASVFDGVNPELSDPMFVRVEVNEIKEISARPIKVEGGECMPEESEEEYSVESSAGAIVIVVEAPRLVPHVQGTSTPQRIAGQRWRGGPAIVPRKFLRLPWRGRA